MGELEAPKRHFEINWPLVKLSSLTFKVKACTEFLKKVGNAGQHYTKGQLISECLFDKFMTSKRHSEINWPLHDGVNKIIYQVLLLLFNYSYKSSFQWDFSPTFN